MIWAPILVKYAYYTLVGVEAGYKGRIGKYYTVVYEKPVAKSVESD